MSALRRVEHVFALFAAGARVVEDPPLIHYVLGDRHAVVVDLPTKLTFRPGGRPRYAHGLGNSHHELLDHPMAPREGFVLLDCDDWAGASSEGETWWFRRDPAHQRQIDQNEVCICDQRPAWGVIECPIHGVVNA